MTEETTGYHRPEQQVPAGGARVIAGRYLVRAELGRGGMGVVWRAEDQVIGRTVAVKELRLPDVAEEASVFQERVLREVRTGGSLNDPAVVTVYDVVVDRGATYIVMELVEAPTLSELVRRNGPLPPHQVGAIGEQVLSALNAAHRSGIVHRDVKPGNIMVAADGRVKLTDFGIAQAVDDPRLTTSGTLVGSPAFMAPERVAGREALAASDLWSLGATLFFATEGIVAHERSSTAATLHAIMNEIPYLTHAQGPLASAIMGLLIASPEGRLDPGQASTLLRMAAAGQGQSTPAGGSPTALHPGNGQPPTMVGGNPMTGYGRPEPVSRKGKRGPWIAAAAVGGVLLLAAGFFVGKPFWEPAADEAMLPTYTYGSQNAQIPNLNLNTSSRCVNTSLAVGQSLVDSNWNACDEPHNLEWFAEGETTGSETKVHSSTTGAEVAAAAYPGVEPLTRYAESFCSTVFHSNTVVESERPKLKYRALIPDENAWKTKPAKDSDKYVRTVVCFLEGAGLTKKATVELQ